MSIQVSKLLFIYLFSNDTYLVEGYDVDSSAEADVLGV